MRVMFAGGGTGGHLYPGLALATELRRRDPETAIAFMGTAQRIEARLVPEAGYPFCPVDVMGMPRRLGPELFRFAKTLIGSVLEAQRHLRAFKPDVVVGTGGYVSAPAILAAAREGLPTLICEQNRLPGIANRFLSRFVREVATTFPDSALYFPRGKAHCLGNPIRSEILELTRESARERLGFPPTAHLLLVTGGSLGARSINRAVIKALGTWLAQPDWSILHVAGPGDVEAVANETEQLGYGERYRLVPYLDDMPLAISGADLVVSRAGATTVAELTAAGKPMVLVPFEHGGKDQPANAAALRTAGAARVVPDRDLSELEAVVAGLLTDGGRRSAMAEASRHMGRPDAAQAIADRILALASSR